MREPWYLRTLMGLLLMSTSMGIIRPMVSYRALELGATNAQIGLLVSAHAFASVIVAIPAGRWADRFGETRLLVVGSFLMLLAASAVVSIDTLAALAASQALLGPAVLSVLLSFQALIANEAHDSQRESRFGLLSVAGSSGQVLGPALGGFVAANADGQSRVALTAGAATVSMLCVLALISHRYRPVSNGRPTSPQGGDGGASAYSAVLRVWKARSMPHAIVASMTALTTVDLLVAYLPVYGKAAGLSAAMVGLMLSVRAAVSVLSRLVMPRLLEAVGRRRLFLISLAAPALAISVLSFVSSIAVVFAILAIAGFGLGLAQPMSLAWVSRAAPPDVRGLAMGMRLTGNRSGQVVVPAVVAAISGLTGVGGIFVAIGVMLTISTAIVAQADFSDPSQ